MFTIVKKQNESRFHSVQEIVYSGMTKIPHQLQFVFYILGSVDCKTIQKKFSKN